MWCKILNRLSMLPHRCRYKKYFNISGYNIKSSNFFRGEWSFIYGEGKLEIGNGCYSGSRLGIYVADGYKCIIGDNTAISHNVRIYTSNRNPDDIIKNKCVISLKYGDVIIGENCWIGANVFINQGVKIGNNVVIGANAVVTRNIPSNSIAVGAPAKVIKIYEFE